MTRPSPRKRPTPSATLGVVRQKSPSEKLTGQPDKPEPKGQVTHLGFKFLRSETPTGFAAALACKTGKGLVTSDEQSDGGDES